MRTWILLSLAIAAPARADDCDLLDPAPGTGATQIAKALDNQLENGCADGMCPMDLPSPREHHGFFAGGEATAGTIGQAHSDGEALSGGTLVADGKLGWRSGLQACASTNVIAGTESRGDTQFHLVWPWPFFETAMLGGGQQWQLRPRLDSSRIYLRRLYSQSEFSGGIGVVVWAHKDGGNAAALAFRFDNLTRDQDRSGAMLETIRLSAYESTHPNSHIEIVPVTWSTMYPHGVTETGGYASSELTRADVADVMLRRGNVTYDAALGALFATHRIAVPVAGSLGVAWGPWSLRAARSAFLAMDDSITIENRASAAYSDGRWRAGAFAALTHASDQPRAQLTGGGSAGVDVALPEKVKLALDVELARSYYARLDADPLPRAEFASVGTVQLSRTFTVNPTAHVSH